MRDTGQSAQREVYVNADFDLSLRARWSGAAGSRARWLSEATLYGLLMAGPKGSVLVTEEVPQDFAAYLEDQEISLPHISRLPDICRDASFLPFGWSQQAIELGDRYREPTAHPPLDVIRRVNSRRFSRQLEAEVSRHAPAIGACATLAEVDELLSGHEETGQGWVVKADHGNAALGNRRLRSARLSEVDRRFVSGLLAEDDWVVVERWLPRLMDLCVTGHVAADGSLRDVGLHEVVNTSDGALIGAIFGDPAPLLRAFEAELVATASRTAEWLAAAGYFGPLCVDAFVWDDRGAPRLRPLADLNARCHMSAGALELRKALDTGAVVYWRLYAGRKLELPPSYRELQSALSEDAYDPTRQRGVLLSTPMRLAGHGEGRKPHRIAALLVGASRAEVLEMDHRFRRRFER